MQTPENRPPDPLQVQPHALQSGERVKLKNDDEAFLSLGARVDFYSGSSAYSGEKPIKSDHVR